MTTKKSEPIALFSDGVGPVIRQQYLRPLIVFITLSMAGEFLIFVIWGVILFPQGSLLNKFLWTMVFCGFGMGASLGTAVDLLIVGRCDGSKAILLTTGLSTLLLGILCNTLCWRLDRHFQYFGGLEEGPLFLLSGTIGAGVLGLLGGWALFTASGRETLSRFRI